MRKLILISSIALCSITGMVAQPVATPRIGARLSMEVSAPAGASNIYKVGSGFSAGVTARMQLPKSFYFEPGLLFYFSAMNTKDLVSFDDNYYYEGSAKFYGLRIPFNVGYEFSLSPGLDLGVFTGPWLNINLSASQGLLPDMGVPDPLPDRTVNLFRHGWKRVDALWGFGLSVTFSKCYYIGLSGGVSFTPLASFGNKDKKIRIHRNMVAISLGYNF